MAEAGLTIGTFGCWRRRYITGPCAGGTWGASCCGATSTPPWAFANLVRRGLVAQARRTDDQPFVTVSLTERGQRLIGGIFPRHAAGLLRGMGRLDRGTRSATPKP